MNNTTVRPLYYRFYFKLLYFLLPVIIVAGCSDSPDTKIKRDKMVDLYADVLIFSSAFEAGEEHPSYHEQLDSVLAIHGVTRHTFESSLDYYRNDPHRWKDLMERVVKELEERRDQRLDSPSNRSSS